MKKTKFIILGLLVAIYFMTLGVLLRFSDKSTCPKFAIDSVNVSIDGENVGVAKGPDYLRDFDGVRLHKGERLVLSFALPSTENMFIPAIEYMTDECAYEVKVDNTVIERKYFDREERNAYITSAHSIISLPLDCAGGEEVTITLETTSNRVGNPISDIVVGNRLDLLKQFVFSNSLPLFLGLFLIVYGAIFLVISLILYGWVDGLKSNLLASCICMDLGLFLHAYYGCSSLYMNTDYIKPMMYTTLTLILPLSVMFTFEVSKGFLYEKRKYITIAFGAIFALLNMLHYSGMLTFNNSKWILYIALFTCLTGIVVKNIIDTKMNILDEHQAVEMIGMVTLCVLMYLSAFINMLTKGAYNDVSTVILYVGGNQVSIGALLFAYFQMVNFYVNVTGAYARTREFESLAYLAYADGLTGLYNRSKLNQQLEEWEADEENYCIISFDLNGLKTVNDNYGHNAGDELLKVFGKALKDVYESYDAMVGRVGGDEFMVIIRKVGTDEVEQSLRMLDAKLEVINTVKEVPWSYSTSYGYGFRVECSEDFIHQTYLLADQRMYEAKKEHHTRYHIKPR